MAPSNPNRNILIAQQIAATVPEVSYWGLDTYKFLLPEALQELHRSYTAQSPAAIAITANGVGAACTLVGALAQLAGPKTHRYKRERAIASLKIANSLQLLACTVAAGIALPISSVIANSIDFFTSLEQLYIGIKRHYSFHYWLQDSLAELAQLEHHLEQAEAEPQPEEPEKHQQRLVDLQQQRLALQKAMLQRIGYRKKEGLPLSDIHRCLAQPFSINTWSQQRQQRWQQFTGTISTIITAKPQDFDSQFNHALSSIARTDAERSRMTQECRLFQMKPRDYLKGSEQWHRQKTVTDLKQKMHNTATAALATIGSILFCIPGLQFISAFFIAAAAVLYFEKNLRSLFKTIFPEKKPITQIVAPPSTPLLTVKRSPAIPILAPEPLPSPLLLAEQSPATAAIPPAPPAVQAQESICRQEPAPQTMAQRIGNQVGAAVGLGLACAGAVIASTSDIFSGFMQ